MAGDKLAAVAEVTGEPLELGGRRRQRWSQPDKLAAVAVVGSSGGTAEARRGC